MVLLCLLQLYVIGEVVCMTSSQSPIGQQSRVALRTALLPTKHCLVFACGSEKPETDTL